MENGAFTATFFYAEVDGRPEDRGLARAFEELQFFSEQFEILGVYSADPSGRAPDAYDRNGRRGLSDREGLLRGPRSRSAPCRGTATASRPSWTR